MSRNIGDPLAAVRSLVDASLERGELSYFHAFRDTPDWAFEPGSPQLIASEAPPLHADQQKLLDAKPEDAQLGVARLSDPDVLRLLGEEWLRRKNFALSAAAFQRALELVKASADASRDREALDDRTLQLLARRSAARRGAGDVAGALEDAERCSKGQRDWAYAHYLRGQALSALGRYDEAHRALRKAAALEQESAARAVILDAQDALAPHLSWGEDISVEKDGSALLRIVHRGGESRPFAEDLSRVRCHCRLHDQCDDEKRFDGSEPGKVRWSSYATQQGVAYEYCRDDPNREPLEWVLGEDDPPFPLLDAVVRRLRVGGEAKVRLSSKGAFGRSLPMRGSCDAHIYLVGVTPACQGPEDQLEWMGLRSVSAEVLRGAELLGRAVEAFRASASGAAVARHAAAAERRYVRAGAWLECAWGSLQRDDADGAEALRLRGLSGRARAGLWRREGLAAEAASAAPSDLGATLAQAVREGRASEAALSDVKSAVELASRAVDLSRRKSAPALHSLGLALFVSGDAAGARSAFEEAVQIDPSSSSNAARDALVQLRAFERSARGADALASAAQARDRLEAGIAAKSGAAMESALRELLSGLSAGLSYEAAATSLKLGKLAATVSREFPGTGAATAASDLIAQLRRMAMAQGRQ